jgi:hypothetical protein
MILSPPGSELKSREENIGIKKLSLNGLTVNPFFSHPYSYWSFIFAVLVSVR